MSLSDFAMRNRAIVTSAVVLLMGWGILAYLNMPRRENPKFIWKPCSDTDSSMRLCRSRARWAAPIPT